MYSRSIKYLSFPLGPLQFLEGFLHILLFFFLHYNNTFNSIQKYWLNFFKNSSRNCSAPNEMKDTYLDDSTYSLVHRKTKTSGEILVETKINDIPTKGFHINANEFHLHYFSPFARHSHQYCICKCA